MKTKLLLLSIAIVFSIRTFSQVSFTVVPNLDFVGTATGLSGLDAQGMASAINKVTGHIYLAGYITVSGQKDLYVVEFDSTGAQVNQASYDYAGFNDRANAVCVTSSSVFVTGFSEAGSGNSDVVTIAYDLSLNQLWVQRVAGSAGQNDAGNSIATDGTNIFVGGWITQTSKGKDYTIFKYNSTGSLTASVKKNGNNQDDICEKIVVSGSNLYSTGSFHQSGSNNDVLTMCVSTSGTMSITWSVTANGTASGGNDTGKDLKLDGNNLIICGSLNNSGTSDDYYYAVLTATSGAVTYSNTADAHGGSDVAASLACNKAGKYAITGLAANGSNYEIFSRCYTANSYKWSYTYPINGNYSTTYPHINTDTIIKRFYVCGTYSSAVTGSLDALLFQLDTTGAKKWERPYNGWNGKDIHTDMILDGYGRIYTSTMAETTSPGSYFIKCLRYSQSALYSPLDSTGEDFSRNFLFYQNKGQLLTLDTGIVRADSVKYYNTFAGPAYYIENDRIQFALAHMDTVVANMDTVERMEVQFANCNPYAETFAYDTVDFHLNYFTQATDSNGIKVVGNKRVFVPNLYPDIDLHYYSNRNGLKYYFVIKPWAPEAIPILLKTSGSQTTSIISSELVMQGVLGKVDLGSIYSYQVDSLGAIKTMSTMVTWNQVGVDSFNFSIPPYNHNLPLVILVSRSTGTLATAATSGNFNLSTYYGGTSNDEFKAIKVDKKDTRYIAGYTKSNFYPTINGLTSSTFKGVQDIIIHKYVAGDTLKVATIFGGNDVDDPAAIGLLSNGHVVISGVTGSTNLLVVTSKKPTADQQTTNSWISSNPYSFRNEGLVLELNNRLDTLIWDRYYGGEKNDAFTDMAIDKNDNIYLVGGSNSCSFPVKNAYKNGAAIYPSCYYGKNADMVYVKMNGASQVGFASYLGGNNLPTIGSNQDNALGVDVDSLGLFMYIVGTISQSTDLTMFDSTGYNYPLFNSFSDGTGGVIARINNSTGRPDFIAEIGTDSYPEDIKVMPDQTLLMCGLTNDSTASFPLQVLPGGYNHSNPKSGITKGFIINTDYQMAGIWSTFFSRAYPWYPTDFTTWNLARIAVSDNGSFYIGGYALYDSIIHPASAFPGVYTNSTRTQYDGFISYFSNFSNSYNLLHSHYLGGTSDDYIHDIGVYRNSSLYAVGGTYSGNFPIYYSPANTNLIVHTHSANFPTQLDCFAARFDISAMVISVKEITKSNNELSVTSYPNPVSDQFYINMREIKDQKNISVKVYNTVGQLVYSEKLSNFNTDLFQVFCPHWANGMYLINVLTDTKVYSGKVVKQ